MEERDRERLRFAQDAKRLDFFLILLGAGVRSKCGTVGRHQRPGGTEGGGGGAAGGATKGTRKAGIFRPHVNSAKFLVFLYFTRNGIFLATNN